jgi:cell division transport system permease protein
MSLSSTLWFFISEAGTNIRRAGLMTVITVTTIGIALLMMGAFLLATMNVESFLNRLQAEAMVTAFLAPGTPEVAARNLKLKITAFDEAAQITMVTPDEAARELFMNPEDQKLLEVGMGDRGNPLPTTFRIKVRSSHDLDSLLRKLKAFAEIESVSYGEEVFRQFQGLSELLWIGSLLIILLLGAASLFIVFNTVRLTLFMRREEIIIMRLVGATNWFIRFPFIIEGLIHGILGAILALAVLLIGYRFILVRLAVLTPFFPFDVGAGQLLKLSTKLFLMGIVLGVTGSLLSLRDLRSFSRRDQ